MASRRGSCIDEIVGWEGRAARKAAAGAVLGAFAGMVACAFRPSLGTAGSAAMYTAASSAVALGAYSCTQEAFRALTCQDSPMNSLFAGGITGNSLRILLILGNTQYAAIALLVASHA
eukprot:scaffold163961_cov44-Prasinocladus_malaysianus.AAC.2